jgi:hypothetical protein
MRRPSSRAEVPGVALERIGGMGEVDEEGDSLGLETLDRRRAVRVGACDEPPLTG